MRMAIMPRNRSNGRLPLPLLNDHADTKSLHPMQILVITTNIQHLHQEHTPQQLPYCKNHFGTSGPQTAKLSSPAIPHPTGVSLLTKSPSA